MDGVFPTLYFRYVNSDSKHPLFFQIRYVFKMIISFTCIYRF